MVNGTDVSTFPHEDAVRAFLTAEEPIVVELKRRVLETNNSSTSTSSSLSCDTQTTPCSCLVSTAVQTDISGIAWMEDPSLESFTHDIDLEEVTLRKCSSDEKLGLTVCYSSGSEVDTYTEVYIREIAPHSVAERDGRLKQGDQILQVNGKDVSNKEETESLFAENNKAVTLLISRCMNQNEDEGDENQESPGNLPYQNSFIEQLLQQQQLESLQHSASNEPAPTIPPHSHMNLTNSLVRSKIDSISNEISKLDQRMQNIQLIRTERHKNIQLLPDSDTEHIYETIPESDLEPIYSYPYEPDQENILKKWLVTKGTDWPHPQARDCKERDAKIKDSQIRSKSSKSNSSEEHENSSSAYNTGGSSNSNHLTFELGCYADPRQTETYRSTLILCSSADKKATMKTTEMFENCDTCKTQAVTQKKKTKAISSKNSPSSPTQRPPAHLLSDTMYTNIANLQQTMLLQQELFRQALGYQDISNKPTTSFTSPSLSQYQFSHTQFAHKKLQTSATVDTKMEWKVKRRPDGTRYIARRPIRNRILKNRAIRISEDRAGLTTEDDTISELKVGRYWTKEERKRHLEKSRERKQRQEILLASRYVENTEVRKNEKLASTSKKASCSADPTKKHKNKKGHKEGELTTVQDVLVHGPKMISNPNSKMIGLLSVTTV
ncbi:E3 ubiquitin-protein ligase PDZRN3 isoform X2 [Agrilus planipennis]|uniref:E3 ubiquitin-protein ligase PDZRN3 isoform X2 n=1 Tax=Agrilus planipennis TaxID=224129 RepID=A0A1W4WQ63_AGRPL|nr:E3 ubiquitin-protein ligase PDZRN3 isoform X2 [Agrilus planipennis]